MRSSWMWLCLGALACGPNEKAEDPDRGAGNDGDDDDDDDAGCVDDEGCPSIYEICDLDEDSDTFSECIPGDRNNEAAEAVPLELSDFETPLKKAGVIHPAGDVDYYVYDSPGDEWVSVRTETGGDRDVLDTYVTIFAPDGELHARLDNYPTGLLADPLDTVLYTYLPEAGDYVIQVEDVTTAEVYDDFFYEEDWRGGEELTYEIYVREAFGIAEPDAADDPGSVTELDDGLSITAVGVRFEEAGDVDHLEIQLTAIPGEPLEAWVQPDRPASVAEAQLDLYDPTGAWVASKYAGDGSEGYLSYFGPEAGTYQLRASDVSGNSGGDSWYVVYLRTYQPDGFHPFFGDSIYTVELEPNDLSGQATPVPEVDEVTSGGSGYKAFHFEGFLGEAELVTPDVDRFSVVGQTGQALSVRCFGQRFGSLWLPQVRLYQGANDVTPEGQGDVDLGDGYWIANAVLSGAVDVEFTTLKGDPLGLGAYYRCVVYVTPFEVDVGTE